MRLFLAILVGKLISFLTRIFHLGGGSAAPGLYALKIEPKLVEKLIHQIPQNIIITGTNGKTTTARMLAHMANSQGLKVIRNHTGSNLERGIASALISHLGGVTYDIGVWELDEAAFNSLAPKIKPDIVVFLNVFRDQLDRYGEVDSVVKKWSGTLKKLPLKTTILVNGDDVNTVQLAKNFPGKVETFGVENYKIVGEAIEKQKTTSKLDFEARNVKLNGLQGSSFQLTINNEQLTINLPLPGIYHIYDALAAITAASHLFADSPTHRYTDTLIHFSPAFGRMEKFSLQSTPTSEVGYIFLIKNPAGATQVFETIAPHLKPQDRLLLALNDKLADGTDVSWIWDAEFERLQVTGYRLQVVVSGTRADDLALRLKYAGFEPNQLHIQTSLEYAFVEAQKGLNGALYILPTYTAMLEFQKLLTKSGIKKHYWQEN